MITPFCISTDCILNSAVKMSERFPGSVWFGRNGTGVRRSLLLALKVIESEPNFLVIFNRIARL
jgi:hypothetical protein